ncbi:hypothetical protein NMY22_g7397 [Coprinellus aureogranulatus]|nr:hypothetical protein NMY22_g7397 [Coprinellus aureogranulatus]
MSNSSSSSLGPRRCPVKTLKSHSCQNCGKHYSTEHHLSVHQARSCAQTKRTLSELLQETKSFWESRKRRRFEAQTQVSDGAGSSTSLGRGSTEPHRGPSQERSEESDPGLSAVCDLPVAEGSSGSQDLALPLSIRKATRLIQLPKRFRQDEEPSALPSARITAPSEPLVPSPLNSSDLLNHGPPLFVYASVRDKFGILRRYVLPSLPTHDPDESDALNKSTLASLSPFDSSVAENIAPPSLGPFKTESAFDLAEWYWQSTTKSFSEFQKLLAILTKPSFSLSDVVGINWRTAFHTLGANASDLHGGKGDWIKDGGWLTTPISIDVPFHSRLKDPGVKPYLACNFYYRSIVGVIREKLTDRAGSSQFHYYPFKPTWKPGDGYPEVELYGELYNSRAFREAHEEVQKQAYNHRNDGLERLIVAVMLWSDSTQLTSFGSAYLWPCYLFSETTQNIDVVGHPKSSVSRLLTSTRQAPPVAQLANHQQTHLGLQLPGEFNDYLKKRNDGKLPTDAVSAHCARELFHKQWSILLDAELSDAMEHGLVIVCPDGKKRCFYPRIFTYSADYPEKSVVQNAEAVTKAREEIASGYAVDGANVEAILKDHSLVPTQVCIPVCHPSLCYAYCLYFPLDGRKQCVFSEKLSSFSFNITSSLVVDILHEFEVGVWKRLFIHLIRLLEAHSGSQNRTLTAELDVRSTPSFGRDIIRRFGTNASEMKRRAARDYENLLQCAIPAFEGLLPENINSAVMKLLFVCAQWHALAKLRMHHDLTLDLLDYWTILLGAEFRKFHELCSSIPTKELKKEADARARREGKSNGKAASSSRKPASLNIFTIKFHYLGDYSSTIRKFGTTDSYSTETGELYHKGPKAWYPRTDKKNYHAQLSSIERRQARLSHIRYDLDAHRETLLRAKPFAKGTSSSSNSGRSRTGPPTPSSFQSRLLRRKVVHRRPPLAFINLRKAGLSYFSNSTMGEVRAEGYFVDFNSNLKRHLHARLCQKMGFEANNAGEHWLNVVLQHDQIYSHKILRMYYTGYDVRREEEVIHVNTPQCNIMLLNDRCSKETWAQEHPYLYGRVLGVFHANVAYARSYQGNASGERHTAFRRIDFVWVQWYEYLGAEDEYSLDRLSLRSLQSANSLCFLDPQDILRGVHLIPQYPLGESTTPRPSFRWSDLKGQSIWTAYYINRFADRDLFMRYQYGLSVGHTYMYTDDFPRARVPVIGADFNYGPHVELGDDDSPIEDEIGPERDNDVEELSNELDDHENLARAEMYP